MVLFCFYFILPCSQEEEENLVQKESKDPTGQLEHQGSQDTQDPWVTRGRGVSLASQESLALLWVPAASAARSGSLWSEWMGCGIWMLSKKISSCISAGKNKGK